MTTRSALIARKQLNSYEEAKAVRALIDRGLTENGAAQALGWPNVRVTARVKVLESCMGAGGFEPPASRV
jgi:hypothetical protein